MPSVPNPRRRPSSPALTFAAALAALTALAVLPSPAPAQGDAVAKPAKKDSSARVKPKDVTLTTVVVPAEAKPGETVRYQVTAKLNPGWHIYTYARDQQGPGPRNTRFDLFDPAGLTVAGDWTASKPAVRKKEPAFPELKAVEFFEDEVTWSLPLSIPADAAPGAHVIRCQASYQVCNAQSCSFPGYWTLPDATLTVVARETAAAPAPAEAAKRTAVAVADEGPKPKKGDTPERIRPKAAQVSASVDPAEAKPGQAVTLKVTAKLDPGWHIYEFAKAPPANGPSPTQFDVFDPGGLAVAGDWSSDRPPVVKQEPAFNNMIVQFYEDEVVWSLPLKVPAGAKPGKAAVRVQAAFQICDATSCMPPVRWTLPDAVVTVAGAADTNLAAATGAAAKPSVDPEPGPAVATEAPAAAGVGAVDAAPASRGKRVVSEVEEKAAEGVIPLMIASALGGLFALVMPCVWPMVPITVNFFVKQGQAKGGARRSTTGLALVYCLAIILVFTAVGVLCSFFLSANSLTRLANTAWLNFAVAGLFFAFGLSLLGLFEIRLPNALLNASTQGESRGGLVGVMFMALTLTITSFTCTFPVVGGLLVMASNGQFFYPIVGLATFATVLALPFFLLALAPGLLSKVPRSGDWMNAVKVVGGLIEVGAAFKFLNTAELSRGALREDAWVNATFMLTAWVVLAAVCGFYLLGFFRTDHDHEEVKVGPGRMVAGSCFLGIALFFAPALFGRAPQGPLWNLVVGLFPPDIARLTAAPALVAGTGGAPAAGEAEVHATDTDPDRAQRQERRFHGVWWGFSYEGALEQAKAESKPVLIDFTGLNCANCRTMEQTVLPRPEVVEVLKRFVPVELYTLPSVPIASLTVDQREALANKNAERQIDWTSDATNPWYVVVSPDGQVLGAKGGLVSPTVFVDFLNRSLEKARGGSKVAQAEAGR